ncbi:MAG: DUF1893 domain-containing protein [Candidatus Thermoplasmatota archaeon]
MAMIDEKLIDDLKFARENLNKSDCSILVVKDGEILLEKQGYGIKPLLETIEELEGDMKEAVVGDKLLGKAAALLCRYAEVKSVYAPRGTKTGLAVLIVGGVPSRVDELIPFIKDKSGDGVCPFEKILEDVDKPAEAYQILKEKVL